MPLHLDQISKLVSASELIDLFFIFCRVGGFLMVAPGFGSNLVPGRVRLMVAIAVTLALAPIIQIQHAKSSAHYFHFALIKSCLVEAATGISIGVIGRMFVAMLEFAITVASIGVGWANPFGIAIEQGEIMPPLATFATINANVLIFALDLHWQILSGLLQSYTIIPFLGGPRPDLLLDEIITVLGRASQLALRASSPFLVYSILVNFTISLINRLTPQIAVFYISTPFVLAGALWTLENSIHGLLSEVSAGFAQWQRGE